MLASFAPIVNENTKILILGTMPGVQSLAKLQYYAHPQNQFWKIIYSTYATHPVADLFEEKIALLQQHHLGLWDVLAYCERKGSLDVHIKNQIENDISDLIRQFPKIKKILFNGKQSYQYFQRKFGQIEGVSCHVMPSTSPAHTMKFEQKLLQWQRALLG